MKYALGFSIVLAFARSVAAGPSQGPTSRSAVPGPSRGLAAQSAATGPCSVTPAPTVSADDRINLGRSFGGIAGIPTSLQAATKGDLKPAEVARDLELFAATLRAKATETPKDAPKLEQAAAILDRRVAAYKALAGLATLKVSSDTTVLVTLTNPPSTRLRLTFDGENTGAHHELEWDPAIVASLGQRVELAQDTWRVSATVEPIYMQQGEGSTVVAVQFTGLQALRGGTISLAGIHTALVVAGRYSEESTRQVTMSGWPEPTLAFVCGPQAMQRIDDLRFAPQTGGQIEEKRSISTAPSDAIAQTLSILAQIAVERARSGAMAVLKERFVDPLCTGEDEVTLAKLGLGTSSELAFPRTCQLLESLRMNDILSSGVALLRTLRDDGRYTIAQALIAKLVVNRPDLVPLLNEVLAIANRAIDRGSFDALEGELVLDLVGNPKQVLAAMPTIKIPDVGSLRTALGKLLHDNPTIAHALCANTTIDHCLQQEIPSAASLDSVVSWADHESTSLQARDATLLSTALHLDVLKAVANLKTNLEPLLKPDVLHRVCPSSTTAAQCVADLAKGARTLQDWVHILSSHDLLSALSKTAIEGSALAKPVAVACQAQLAVAIVKQCTKASCTSEQISDMLSNPGAHFAPDPASMCWEGTSYVPAPGTAGAMERLVIDGLDLVAPVQAARGRDRAVAAIQLVLHVVGQLPDGRDARVAAFGDLAIALARDQYDTALADLTRLAEQLAADENLELPRGVDKLTRLVGAVAAYTTVYEQTKDDDAKAASAARKQALESLIDAATSRTNRDHDLILSLGSDVGGSLTYSNTFDRKDTLRRELAVRVPLGLALEVLPGKWKSYPATPSWSDKLKAMWGLHFGINLLDLGRFVSADAAHDIQWSSFIAPGVEAGVLFGSPEHTLSLTVHGAFAPSGADPMAPGHAEWQFGVAVGYYVPFFDFN